MHIPDGFIAPQMYLPAYAAAAGLWTVGLRRLKSRLREETLPILAAMTGFAFVLMTIAVPVPGGTSAHASGVALLAILFGVWTCFLSVSLVLLLQALLFGAGGITSLPLNALALGLAGGGAASLLFRALSRRSEKAALIAAGWISVTVPALLLAIVLGAQPRIAHAADGSPLFFPFGFAITIPALLIPHALVGIGEGVLTLLVYRLVGRLRRGRER
ncbi:MAG: energy-coupling factor ABC transporter permease [Candidatus Eisenbacteria bacterium]|nr:energy-coupling factor ABC transporter permease [Candidatus Eisenbacteria bacterium]